MNRDVYTPLSTALWEYLEAYDNDVEEAHSVLMDKIVQATITEGDYE